MSARKRTRSSSNASISADSAPPNESPESLTSNINNDVQNETVSDGVAQDHTKAKEGSGDNNGDNDNDNDDDDDDEYEEALVYVELPAFANQHYLSQAKRRIVIQGLCGGGVPSLLVDGSAEFKGEHTINLGSNHFFECSSSSNSSSAGSSTPLEYKGHSIKTTEFTLSRILRSGVDQNENDNASDQENIDNDDDDDENDNASGQENAEDEEDDGDNVSG